MSHAAVNAADNNRGGGAAVGRTLPNTLIYVASLAPVAIVFVLQSLLAPMPGNQSFYLFLVPPVFIAGAIGGLGPGLLATASSLGLHLYATAAYSNRMNPD